MKQWHCWSKLIWLDLVDKVTVDLPYGRKRALEIATTLGMEPELMLLDEPTRGMGHEDVHRVTELIKSFSPGRTILMVEHNMSVVSGICDKISVLQRGAVLAEGDYAEVPPIPKSWEAYMGSSAAELQEHIDEYRCTLEISDLAAWYGESHILHQVNLRVDAGEVVTLLGRNGAGRTTSLRAIMGLTGKRTGSVKINRVEAIHLPTYKIAHLELSVIAPKSAAFFVADDRRKSVTTTGVSRQRSGHVGRGNL